MSATSKGGRLMTRDLPSALERDFGPEVDPADWSPSPSGDATDAGKWWCLPVARGPSTAESFEGPSRPPAAPWQRNAGRCADQSFSLRRREEPLRVPPTRPPYRTSELRHRAYPPCLEINKSAASSNANTRARLRAVWD